ncbi:FxsA family membrane protein [Streptomyces orinoci]|uniref:FxsA family membrane protein n=1 Tax=Streptomyces orinoci TaxID=67339 RepID=A0ABV3K6A7_STRON|nr:FxsA family membrane protein [Streptomyces orinoci]
MTFGMQQQSAPTRPPGRSRIRRILPPAVAAWVLLELWLLILVADAAGGLTVFLLLAGGLVLGALVIKRAGRRAWERLTASLQSGAAPESGGNAVIMLGGLLLMVPGLLSDVAGLLCLFPPTGALVRRAGARWLNRPGPLGEAFQQAQQAQQARTGNGEGVVIQGEVIRDDQPPATPRQDPQLPH